MNQKEESVPIGEARKAVQDMARRVALLHMSFARVLVDEFGEERGRVLVRRAIWRYGAMIGERTKAAVEELGLEPTIENMEQGSDLSPLGFAGSGVVIGGEARSRIRFCPLAMAWREYGEEDLGAIYCQVDPAKTQAYDAGWTMIHTRRMPDGDDFCEIAVRPLATPDERAAGDRRAIA